MKYDTSNLLREGHRMITAFINQHIETVEEGFVVDSKQQSLLRTILNHSIRPAKEVREELMMIVKGARSNKTKVKNDLNEKLHQFCQSCHIDPSIKVYFGSLELRKHIVHFACCNNNSKAKSSNYVDLTKLEEMLKKASDSIKHETFEQDHETIGNKIHNLLKSEALHHLCKKLKSNDKNDYQLLGLECGTIKKDKIPQEEYNYDDRLENQYNHNRKWEKFDFEALLKPFGIYILSSNVGSGKTTFLRHLQWKILEKNDQIAIYVHAAEIENGQMNNMDDFMTHLAKQFYPESREKVKSLLEHKFSSGKIVLLVDGLDQIHSGGAEYEPLTKKIMERVQNNLIIASRPSAVNRLEDDKEVIFLRLLPFDEDMQKEYFGEYYKRAVELSKNTSDLVRIPMLAYMVRTLIEKKLDINIRNRAELYKEFVNYILGEYEHGEAKLTPDLRISIRQCLRKISYDALDEEKPFIQKIPLEYYYKQDGCLPDGHAMMKAEVLTKCGLVNLIVETSAGVEDFLYFTHQSFQEYLAAEGAAKDENKINHILDKMWDPKWKEVIKFLAGFLGEKFIKKIYPQECKDNCIHSRLFLAAECCGELGYEGEIELTLLTELNPLVGLPPFRRNATSAVTKLNVEKAGDVLIKQASKLEPGYYISKYGSCWLLDEIRNWGRGLSNRQIHKAIQVLKLSDNLFTSCLIRIFQDFALTGQLDASHVKEIVDVIYEFRDPDGYKVLILPFITKKLLLPHMDRFFTDLQNQNVNKRNIAAAILHALARSNMLEKDDIECISKLQQNKNQEIRNAAVNILEAVKHKHTEAVDVTTNNIIPSVSSEKTDRLPQEEQLSEEHVKELCVSLRNVNECRQIEIIDILRKQTKEKVVTYIDEIMELLKQDSEGSLRKRLHENHLKPEKAKVIYKVLLLLRDLKILLSPDHISIIMMYLESSYYVIQAYSFIYLWGVKDSLRNEHIKTLFTLTKSDIELSTIFYVGVLLLHVSDRLSADCLIDLVIFLGILDKIVYNNQKSMLSNDSYARQLFENWTFWFNTVWEECVSIRSNCNALMPEDSDWKFLTHHPFIINRLTHTHRIIAKNIEQLGDKNFHKLVEAYIENPVSCTLSYVISELPEQLIAGYVDEIVHLTSEDDLAHKINIFRILNKVPNRLQRNHLRQIKTLLNDQNLYVRDCAYDFLREIYHSKGVSI